MRLAATSLAIPGRLEPSDLVVERPSLVCLVGPNGSGKTSLLHALAGIGRPQGEMLIDSASLSSRPVLRRHEIGFLPASRDIAWPLSARDLVVLGGATAEEAGEALAALGAADLADRRVDQMSTGERSRVLLARVLAPAPKLLLLDEPAANLDPAWQLRLMDLLASLPREDGRTVIAAMHDLDLAATYADRLLIMDSGRIAADGTPAELLNGPIVRDVFGVERAAYGWRLAD